MTSLTFTSQSAIVVDSKKHFKSSQKSDLGAGLVSILTSDKHRFQLPSQEYLRIKRLQKCVRVSAQVVEEKLQQMKTRYKAAMVTLTYRDDVDWQPRHISAYLKNVREWAKRKKIFMHYVWVLELTKRGRPHYHVLFWLPKGVSMPKADKQGWWKHGFTRSEWARKPVGYLCKYTSKGIDFDSWQKLPRGGRMHGNGGFTPKMRILRCYRCAPSWIRELVDESDGVKKVGRYWCNRSTGWGLASPFLFYVPTRELVWRGFTDPIHESEIFVDDVPVHDFIAADILTLAENYEDDYYLAIDQAIIYCSQRCC